MHMYGKDTTYMYL